MNYLVPGAYPGEVGGGSGGSVETIVGGNGIQASTDLLNNVFITNFGAISITGSGEVLVTEVDNFYTADVPVVTTSVNGASGAITLSADNNGITLINNLEQNTFQTNFVNASSEFDTPVYTVVGTTLTITLTSLEFFQRKFFCNYEMNVPINGNFTPLANCYMTVQAGTTAQYLFRKTVNIHPTMPNMFTSGSFYFSTAAPRALRVVLTFFNVTFIQNPPINSSSIYSLNLYS